MSRKNKIIVGSAMILLIVAGAAFPRIMATIAVVGAGTAYIAKALCTGVLVGGMEPERLLDQELSLGRGVVSSEVLEEEGEVIADALFGMVSARARRQANLG